MAVRTNGLELEGLSVQLMPADDRLRYVYVRNLPFEVDNNVFSSFFLRYAEVLSVDHSYFDDFPSLCNWNQLVKILLAQDIPSFARVKNCECRVWYPRQPPKCSIWREFGHRAPACPLSGLYRRCRQPSHVARQCTQAWGLSASVFSPASDGSSDESDLAMEQSSPSQSIVASVPASAQSTPSSVPNDSGHVMEEFPRSRRKAPAVSALSLFLLSLLPCLPLTLQLLCLLLLLPSLSLVSCLPPLLLLLGLFPPLLLPHLLLLQLPLPLLWLPLLSLLQLLRLFLPLIRGSFLLPR